MRGEGGWRIQFIFFPRKAKQTGEARKSAGDRQFVMPFSVARPVLAREREREMEEGCIECHHEIFKRHLLACIE
jgi:hypothetical protein